MLLLATATAAATAAAIRSTYLRGRLPSAATIVLCLLRAPPHARYMLIRDAPELAAFMRQAVDQVSALSYQLLPADACQPASSGSDGVGDGVGVDFGQGCDHRSDRNGGGGSGFASLLSGGLSSHGGGDGSDGSSRRGQLRAWLAGGREMRARLALLHPGAERDRTDGTAARFRLGAVPAGVDPVRQAWLFNRQLRRRLLDLFVPDGGGARAAMTDVAVLEAEHAELAEAHAWRPNGVAGSDAPCWPPLPGTSAPDAAQPGGSAGNLLLPRQQQQQQEPVDTWVAPVCQAGFAGLRQEERLTLSLLSRPAAAAAAPMLLQVSTPYLNLGRPYEYALARAGAADLQLLTSAPGAQHRAPCCSLLLSMLPLSCCHSAAAAAAASATCKARLLPSSPGSQLPLPWRPCTRRSTEANGFYGAKGVSGLIPLAYSTLEHRTWRKLTAGGGGLAAGRRALGQLGGGSTGGGVPQAGGARALLEYARPGWSFHAKGLWLTPGGADPLAGPAVTSIGSSNYGASYALMCAVCCQPGALFHCPPPAHHCPLHPHAPYTGFRSLHRDLEINFIVATANPSLRARFAQEWAALAQHASLVAGCAATANSHFGQPGRRAGVVGRAAVRMLRSFL